MPTDQSKLEPPFEIPTGCKVLQKGYKGDKNGNFKKYFVIYAPEEKCTIPKGKKFIYFDAILVTGIDKDHFEDQKIRYCRYDNGAGNADLGYVGILRFSSEAPYAKAA